MKLTLIQETDFDSHAKPATRWSASFEDSHLPTTCSNSFGEIRMAVSGSSQTIAKSYLAGSMKVVAQYLNEEADKIISTIDP